MKVRELLSLPLLVKCLFFYTRIKVDSHNMSNIIAERTVLVLKFLIFILGPKHITFFCCLFCLKNHFCVNLLINCFRSSLVH